MSSSSPRPVVHTFFMLVRTTPRWLALPPGERFAFVGAKVAPLLAAHPAVSMRYYDAEAFSARVTDVIVWQTAELREYQTIVEKLRETEFWGTYFDVVELVPAVENAYATHYQVAPLGAGGA